MDLKEQNTRNNKINFVYENKESQKKTVLTKQQHIPLFRSQYNLKKQ